MKMQQGPILNRRTDTKGTPLTYNLVDISTEEKATELFNKDNIQILGILGRQTGKKPGLYLNLFVIHHGIPWIECLWRITKNPNETVTDKMPIEFLPKDTALYFPMDEDDEFFYVATLKDIAPAIQLTQMHRIESLNK